MGGTKNTHFCRHCNSAVANSIRKRHTGAKKKICKSCTLHVAQLHTDVTKKLVDHPIIKTESNNDSHEDCKLKQRLIASFNEIVKRESDVWSKNVNPLIKLITNKTFDIYQTMVNVSLDFNLDQLVAVEMFIGEYVYTRLSSCHPYFALQVMGILPMTNILDYLGTTLDTIRSHNGTRGVVWSTKKCSTIVDLINDIYDAMAKLPDTVLLNSMFAYEQARLNQFDKQNFETYDPSTGKSIITPGVELRIQTNGTYTNLFKQHMMVNYTITDPDSNILDLDANLLLPFVDVANPTATPDIKELIVETRNVRVEVLNEMTLFVINRMLGTFSYMGETSSFTHGNIVAHLYPRF